MAHDALGAHARDELGIIKSQVARPIQAAVFSAASFSIGAALPLAVTALSADAWLIPLVTVFSLMLLATLGAVAARTGGANIWTGAWRVLFWGALAMGVTALIGHLIGGVV
jgi:VIT1/CCC1 family predicted Fe2+/Mn2+ transporter